MQTRENMLDYVINLLEDAQNFSWASTKASHAVLLYHSHPTVIDGYKLCPVSGCVPVV